MKKTLLALLAIATPIFAHAGIIYQDTFNYSNGPVAFTSTNGTGSTTISNWITHSGSQDAFVNNRRLEVSSSSTFLGVTVTRTGDIHRNFSMTNGSPYTNAHQVVYASFIVNFTNLPTANGAYFAHFQNGASTFFSKLFALTGNPGAPTNNFVVLPNTFRLGVLAGGSGAAPANKIYPVDLALNTDYQVVMGWDPVSLIALTLWVNPVSSGDFQVTTGDPFTPSAANIAQSFSFRQASPFGAFLTVSNLVLSSTFDDALTNVMSTNAVAPKIVYQPTAVNSNFVNATFALSAVANGQGLGSLIYQWQKSASPANTSPADVSNPGGNTNVLGFTSAQVTDSGYYTMIATTPYGLSVTSSVAKVAVTATPVPPSFITQPVSQTVYRGSTVTFSTTVSSPGTVTYQWFSNNIALPTETGSSFTLTSVPTNITGSTYKVAVTNDVVVNGVVSTNAVLTVLAAPVVSIGFLRTLVDGTTFLPTASPTQPYEVTGVVTTLTNITTGNTSSYWLQDGTGGINIFATLASTFRPAQGDSVTFVGVMSSFTSGLELVADPAKPYTSYTINSSGNALPTPKSILFTLTNTSTFTYINTNLAGSRVTLANVYFGTNFGNTISNAVVTVTNSAGDKFNLQFFPLDQDTAGQLLPEFATSVTGVLYGLHPNYTLAVTKYSDIVAPPAAPPTLGVSQAANVLTFSWSASGYNLQSQTNSLNLGLDPNNASWINYPDPSNPVNVTIDPANPTVFYRLYKP